MIYIDNRQDRIQVTEEFIPQIEKVIDFTLKEEGVNIPYEISVILVDNNNIKEPRNPRI